MGKVLVVDDEERLARFVARALQSDSHVVDVASTGPQGLAMALGTSYDLVVLDLMLPGCNGMDVMRQLFTERSDQRVLVLSAVPDVKTRVDTLDMGAADFLPKPFAMAELLARVRSRLAQPVGQPTSMVIEIGSLRLDLRRRALQVDDRMVSLSAREFELLHYLMARKGQVCSRTELLSEVWGYSFDPGTNVVDVSIRRLRSKVGDRWIETVRNVGYAFAVG